MNICIYEDAHWRNLLPLTHCQPAGELRCGIFTMRERIERSFPDAAISFIVRADMKEIVAERRQTDSVNGTPADATLFINSRLLLTREVAAALQSEWKVNSVFLSEGSVAAIAADAQTAGHIGELLAGFESEVAPVDFRRVTLDGVQIVYPWSLIEMNRTMLIEDASWFATDAASDIPEGIFVRNAEQIFIGDGVDLQPGVFLNASDGPIVIDSGATVMSHAVIVGPAYIGANTLIKIGAKIYGGTTIGPHCKIGGEVEGSIVHSYSNKQHDGFLGHSYLAAWTNLGADTNTSDLKNTYGSIRMTLEGTEFDTRQQFLGLVMADHAKCGINTMFNTGTSVGVGSNVFGGNYPPKYIPSFSWGGAASLAEYDVDKCIAVARTVMRRRNAALTDAEERLLRKVFSSTESQRKSFTHNERST